MEENLGSLILEKYENFKKIKESSDAEESGANSL